MKVFDGPGQFTDVHDLRHRLFYQSGDIRDDVLQCERSNVPLDFQLCLDVLAKFRNRYFRQVIFVAQEVVDNQHALALDGLLDRFVMTEGVLLERERQRLRRFGGVRPAGSNFLKIQDYCLAAKGRKRLKKEKRLFRVQHLSLCLSCCFVALSFASYFG